MKRKIKLYIGDIIENIKLAEKIIKDIDYSMFIADKTKNYAVVRCIEIIGEAVKNIPEDVRLKYPSVPWKDMAGMRDVVIRFYMGVDFKIVWDVVIKRYPVLLPTIEKIYNELED